MTEDEWATMKDDLKEWEKTSERVKRFVWRFLSGQLYPKVRHGVLIGYVQPEEGDSDDAG